MSQNWLCSSQQSPWYQRKRQIASTFLSSLFGSVQGSEGKGTVFLIQATKGSLNQYMNIPSKTNWQRCDIKNNKAAQD